MKPKNRPTAFVILAHPDDESFGPGGTVALLSKTHDIYLFCATKGEAGNDHSGNKGLSLHEIRSNELKEASSLLGVKDVIFLGYQDGHLSNSVYHTIVDQITVFVNRLKPDRIITYEPRGVSGHLDHVAMSMIASFIYTRNDCIKELHYFCLDQKQRGTAQKYFIYFPPGYSDEEITKRVDITSVLDKKIAAIKKHVSQIEDVERVLEMHKNARMEECFIVLKKN